jgi:hypothetical protein
MGRQYWPIGCESGTPGLPGVHAAIAPPGSTGSQFLVLWSYICFLESLHMVFYS